MGLAFVLAQLADALTMGPSHELNAAVLALGPAAYAAKLILIAGVLEVARILARSRWARLARPLLTFGTLAGLFGALTNVTTGPSALLSGMVASGSLFTPTRLT